MRAQQRRRDRDDDGQRRERSGGAQQRAWRRCRTHDRVERKKQVTELVGQAVDAVQRDGREPPRRRAALEEDAPAPQRAQQHEQHDLDHAVVGVQRVVIAAHLQRQPDEERGERRETAPADAANEGDEGGDRREREQIQEDLICYQGRQQVEDGVLLGDVQRKEPAVGGDPQSRGRQRRLQRRLVPEGQRSVEVRVARIVAIEARRQHGRRDQRRRDERECGVRRTTEPRGDPSRRHRVRARRRVHATSRPRRRAARRPAEAGDRNAARTLPRGARTRAARSRPSSSKSSPPSSA